MNRKQLLVLVVLVPLVIVGGLLLGRSMSGSDGGSAGGGIQITDADNETVFVHDFLIPHGTAVRIAAGEAVEILPAELTVKVGEALRIVNNDTEDHVVGVFFVASGETLTQRFNSEGILEGECSVHPSGAFTLRVEA